MRDSFSQQRVSVLHPAIRIEVADIISKVENEKFPKTACVRVVQSLRTIEEQNALYAQGRTAPGKIVTNAKGGHSIHNYALAFDFALMYDRDNNGSFEILSWNVSEDFDKDKQADWMEVVQAFKAAGYEWGGDWHSFKDYPHLQKTFGNSVSDLMVKWENKKFIPGIQYVIV